MKATAEAHLSFDFKSTAAALSAEKRSQNASFSELSFTGTNAVGLAAGSRKTAAAAKTAIFRSSRCRRYNIRTTGTEFAGQLPNPTGQAGCTPATHWGRAELTPAGSLSD
jgi:hypothetical protein